MTRAYQKGHARKVLRVDMMLPFSVLGNEDGAHKDRPAYELNRPKTRQENFPENFLTKNSIAA